MNNDRLVHEIDRIERALRRDDPLLVERFRQVQRRNTLNTVVVFSLLAMGAVLLTTGLATASFGTWGTGVIAFVAACLVDEAYRRQLRHPLHSGRRRA